jgi:hypothetical protein
MDDDELIEPQAFEQRSTSMRIRAAGLPTFITGYCSALPLYFDYSYPINLQDDIKIQPPIEVLSHNTSSNTICLSVLADFLYSLERFFFACHACRSHTTDFYRVWNIQYEKEDKTVFRVSVSKKFAKISIDLCRTSTKLNIVTWKAGSQFRSMFIQNYHQNLRDSNQYQLYELSSRHPYKAIGRLAHEEEIPLLETIFRRPIYSSSTLYHKEQSFFHGSLAVILEGWPGIVKLTFNPLMEAPLCLTPSEPIRTITWVVPFFDLIFKRCQYIELDASFKAAYPYVYAVPQTIIENESILLGFVMRPSEMADLFIKFYNTIKNASPIYQDLLKIPVVTDEGSGLSLFCKTLKLRQFLCFKHLLNKFGNLISLYYLVRRVLYCTTRSQFEEKLPLILEIAILIFSTNTEHQKQFEFIVWYHLNVESKVWTQFPTEFEPNYFWNRSSQTSA